MKFKESSLLKKHKQLLGNKRDKRKKVVKSTSPTPDLKKAVIKKQEGGTLFSIYNSIDPYIPPTIDFNAPELETEIVTNPIKKRQAKVIEEAKKSTTNSEVQELKEINSEVPSKKIPKSSETWKSPYSNKSEWVSDLTNAYKKAGITNDNAIRMLISQDALESGWGRSAQGKFNFGNLTTGSSWKGAYVEGKDHDAKGNPIKQRFRAYDSMDEYAADKIQFLKRLYDFDENDDIDKFISKLSGANKGKRKYAEAINYATSLANVYNKFAEGGIIKAQNGSKSEELLVKKALEFGQKTSEKMSPYDIRLIDFIKSKEGFRPKPEKDKTDGKWTVGYGLTDPKLIRKYRNGITEEEASKHLIQHLQMGADSLATMPYYDNLNLGEKTALNDLIYNVGWNKFKNSKRLQSHLRTGNDAGAKKEMNHGEHQARGLKIRRNQNRQMYDSTFSWKYKKGGVAKYQEPAQGIQRRDAVADYRPAILFSPIKRTYTPTPQPILSQDNRTGWDKEVSKQIKEEQARNNNLHKNQHTWNWSAPFNNTRTTASNAGAVFDFNKSAAMSTFATGMGITNPIATATSIAGSMAGAGIGNKVAGDKGSLIGGFVGGLLGDRTFNSLKNIKNTSKNIGIVSDYYKNPNNPLLSEVDWRGWSKGGEINKEHLAEYAAIERAAKANGTWLKTRDGEPWQGDKRTWIQLMSKDGEKFRHGDFPSNRDIWYNGVPNEGTMLRDYPTYTGDTWLADRYEAALPYSKTMEGQVFQIGIPKDIKIKGFDAHGDKFSEVKLPNGTRMKTDRIVDEVKAAGGYDATYIKDVDETWGFKPNDDLILHSGTPRKSLTGNNGNFDLSNPNIYKALIPFLIGGTTYGFNRKNVDK